MRPYLRSMGLCCSVVATLADLRTAGAQVPPDQPKQAVPSQTPQTPQTTPSVAYAVPDSSLRAVVDKMIAIRLQNGQATGGRLLAFDGETVTLAAANGEVYSIPRSEVSGIKLLASIAPEGPPPMAFVTPQEPIPPAPQTRTFAINLSLAPGFAVDLDQGLFHGFANAALIFPIATDGKLFGFSLGAGAGIPVIARYPGFKLDLFGHVNLMSEESYSYDEFFNPTTPSNEVTFAFGVGVGIHYTMQNGFTVGLTCPILGYSVASRGNSNGGADGYYMSSAVTMPLGFLGYRF